MDHTKTNRRPGAENGPSQFHKILKYSLLVAIESESTRFIDCFGYMGADCHSYNVGTYKSRYETLTPTLKKGDASIVIGGDMNILPNLITPDLDVIIKISPSLSRGPIELGKACDHSNYVSGLTTENRGKLVHFGVLDYLNTQSQVDTVLQQDKAKIIYLDKLDQTNAQQFQTFLSSLPKDKTIGVFIDCESLTPDYFPGVSDPSVFGLVEKEAFSILEALGKAEVWVKTVAFGNFNPTVESRRSADCLLYLLYSYLQSRKSPRAN